MSKKEDKSLSEKQQKFLEVLFDDECMGDPKRAKDKAGYAKTTTIKEVVDPIKEEIAERTKYFIAMTAPKAAKALEKIIENPTDLGNRERFRGATDILDRAGMKVSEKLEVETSSPLFILPEKKK